MDRRILRTGLMTSVLGALLLLAACTFTVQPEGTMPAEDSAGSAMPSDEMADTVAEWVLPDGTRCLFSGTGVTVAFDGKRANYTCEPVDASVSTTQTQVILDEPVIAGPTEYLVDFATVAGTEGGFELHASEAITYTAWQVVLEDGRICLHAGFGATMGFDGNRLNYTCDLGDSTADEVGLMGELTNAGEGVWLAQIDEIGRDDDGFVQLSSNMVPVAVVSGVEIRPGSIESEMPVVEMDDALLGTTWQWVGTQYGDDSELVADDPSRYTLTFGADGMVAVEFDCNSGSGPYTVDGSSLIFGALTSTLMACPPDSQADDFARDLGEVYSYVMQDGHLFLSMQLDSGIMEFAPAEEMTDEDGEMEATPEATEEATPEPTEEATPEATEEAMEEADASALIGTTWQWVETLYGNDTMAVADDPSRYTVTFNADGSVGVQFDCNQGGGSYTVDGPSLSFSPLVTTLMACPEGSQADTFAADLAEVNSYVIEDGHLFLAMMLDTGIMEFAPAGEMMDEGGAMEATPEATEEVSPEATEEATEEATPEATEEAMEEADMTNELVGTSWQWERSIYEGDMVRPVRDPSRYTVRFNEDGSVAASLDCNNGSGTYTLEGDSLSFGPIASTRMACPFGSQEAAFLEDLAAVESYVMVDGNLHLTLSTDGVMEFAPVE